MLLLTIFFSYLLLMNVAVVQSNPKGKKSLDESEKVETWISPIGNMSENLLAIQALLVKEEVFSPSKDRCKPKKRTLTSADKIYLMCAGSVLSATFILTSASCLHEADFVRHNINGSLSVMVGPLTETPQIIKISEYFVHPEHVPDPRQPGFTLHNVGVIKLSCRILKNHLTPIRLPTERLADLCAEENCVVAVISKVNMVSFNVYQTNATNVNGGELAKMKREVFNDINMIKILNETTKKLLNFNKITQFLQPNNDKSALEEITKKTIFTNTIYSKLSSRNIDTENINKLTDEISNSFAIEPNSQNKRIFTRSTDGLNGCTQSGSAVMLDAVQGGLVALSCDDRQPETPWQYTDLYDNLDWIKERLSNNPKKISSNKNCKCQYNFYFGNQQCDDCGQKNTEMTSVTETANCALHGFNSNGKNHQQQHERSSKSFHDAILDMYLKNDNKNENEDNKNENEDNKISKKSSNTMSEISSNTNTIEYAEAPRVSYNSTKLRINLNYLSNNKINTSNFGRENEIYINHGDFNKDEVKNFPNYREEKFLNTNSIKNQGHFRSSNEFNFMKENKNLSFQEFFKNDKYEESKIPEKYLVLYKKFLEEKKHAK